MKPGEKYIIEIESVSKMPKGDIAFIKGFKTLVFDGYGLAQLRRAEEISDAYKRGLADGIAGTPATKREIDAALHLGHVHGMDDAWSMIRTMYSEMTIGTLRQIFNMPDVSPENIVMTILNAFPAAEVKKRLDAYEKEQKEKEQKEKETVVPGDEVKFKLSNRTFVVTKVDGEFISGFSVDGSQFCDKRSCNWEKTGRHFDLNNLFQFMGRKDDGTEL